MRRNDAYCELLRADDVAVSQRSGAVLGGVLEQVLLSLKVPKTSISGTVLAESLEYRVGGLGQVIDGDKREIVVGVDQFLPAGDIRQFEYGLAGSRDAANVRHHGRRIDLACGHKLQGLPHVVRIAPEVPTMCVSA